MANFFLKAPVAMLLMLIAAILLALGHHFYYLSLRGDDAEQNTLSLETHVGIGCLIAFVVRALLSATLGIAFIQLFLAKLARNAISSDLADSLYGSQWSMRHLAMLSKTFAKQPVMWILAVLLWTIPMTTVVPPATLTVHLSYLSSPSSGQISVPTMNFSSITIFSTTPDEETSTIAFEGSIESVSQISADVMLSGNPDMPETLFPGSQGNYSWTVSFTGPALQCAQSDETIVQDFTSHVNCTLGSINTTEPAQTSSDLCSIWDQEPIFTAWNPASNLASYWTVESEEVESAEIVKPKPSSYQDQPMELFLAYAAYDAFHFVTCNLANAVYHVNFTEVDGDMNVQVQLNDYSTGPSNSLQDWQWAQDSEPSMSTYDLNAMALLDVVSQALLGQVQLKNGSEPISWSTDLLDTSLLWQTDLIGVQHYYESLAGGLAHEASSEVVPLSVGMENLFQNLVVSLLSKPELSTNIETPYSTTRLTTTFAYSSWRLIISYFLGVGLTTIVALIALYSFSRGVYSRELSDILRVAGNSAGAQPIVGEDSMPLSPSGGKERGVEAAVWERSDSPM